MRAGTGSFPSLYQLRAVDSDTPCVFAHTAQAAAWNADDPNTGYFVAYLDRPAWTPL